MVIFWITEALPLAITAQLPLVLFPTMSIAPSKDVAATYINVIFWEVKILLSLRLM